MILDNFTVLRRKQGWISRKTRGPFKLKRVNEPKLWPFTFADRFD